MFLSFLRRLSPIHKEVDTARIVAHTQMHTNTNTHDSSKLRSHIYRRIDLVPPIKYEAL